MSRLETPPLHCEEDQSMPANTVPASRVELDVAAFQKALTSKVAQVAAEPDHRWDDGFKSYMVESDGSPVVRVAIANCVPGLDIWQGLRSPVHVGMYPVELRDIWAHYAAANIRSTRHDGSPNPLAMPEPFEDAMQRYSRAVIVCAMLAVNPGVYEAYADKIECGDQDPFDYYCRAVGEVGNIIDRAVAKFSLSLMAPGCAVIPMTIRNAGRVCDRTRSEYQKGGYHGTGKSHWPRNSIAAMTDLMRFGVNRLPFLDEIGPDGNTRRLSGRCASIVMFEEAAPISDASGGVTMLDAERLAWLRRLSDYTDVAPEAVAERYCTYNLTRSDGASVCGKCIEVCPSGALANSSPGSDGRFSDGVSRQKHRFRENAVNFDRGNCCRERAQKGQLYEDYACARCEAICVARGIRSGASR
jgi:ferredoxin